jgi:hypothetical protein
MSLTVGAKRTGSYVAEQNAAMVAYSWLDTSEWSCNTMKDTQCVISLTVGST